MKIKKGDKVKVISGKDTGKIEKVLFVDKESNKLRVENVMLVKKHAKRTQKFQGGIIEKPSLINSSKVMLVCSICSSPTRVGKRKEANNNSVRYCKKCSETIDKG